MPRAEDRGLEGQELGVVFLGRGQPAPSPPVKGFGEHCKLPH